MNTTMMVLLLATQLSQVLAHTQATVGVAAIDLDRGRTIAAIRADEPFSMASTYKIPIAVSVFRAVDRGELHLSDRVTFHAGDYARGFSPIRDKAHGKTATFTVGELIDWMVRVSDNTAADYFVRTLGGQRITNEIGIPGLRIDRTETQIGKDIAEHGMVATEARDTATPNAMLQLLVRIHHHQDGLTEASRGQLLEMMTHSKNPDRISKGLPPGTQLAHKTGTMTGVMNDVGIITSADGRRHVAVVVFTKNGNADATQTIADIARSVFSN